VAFRVTGGRYNQLNYHSAVTVRNYKKQKYNGLNAWFQPY
jgi:hypothetical protein